MICSADRKPTAQWINFEQHQGAAIVGRAVALRRGIGVGDTFSVGDVSIQVAAILKSDDTAEENYIYTHLDFLQRTKGLAAVGTVTQFEILLDSGIDRESKSKCREIDDLLQTGPVRSSCVDWRCALFRRG